MAAQASALQLDIEQTQQAEPSDDARQRRLRMTWFFQGMGVGALMLVAVAAVGAFPSGPAKPSGHDAAFAFLPTVPSRTGGLPQATSSAERLMQLPRSRTAMQAFAPPMGGLTAQAVAASPWDLRAITPDGRLAQRVEGNSRRTWKFNDGSGDRVQVALESEGRPIQSEIQLWMGPDYTPFQVKAYSEDGKLRPIHTLIGTKTKAVTVEARNTGQMEFPFTGAANYAQGPLATLALDIPNSMPGAERVDGGAIRSTYLQQETGRVNVVLNTEGRQLKAILEILTGPNNPKQSFEVYTSYGAAMSLVVSFNVVGAGNTLRIRNLSPVEYPLHFYTVEE